MKKLLVVMLLALAVVGLVFAQGSTEGGWPERTITLDCGSKTGGDVDQVQRLLAPMLQKELGVSVVCQNTSSNGGNMALQAIIEAPAEGYNFFLSNGSLFTSQVTGKYVYDINENFDIVCTVAKADTQVLVVDAKSDITTPEAMAKKIKEQPNTVKFAATIGAPSQFHAVAVENAMGGKFKKVDVSSGSDKLVALLSGEVNVVSSTHSLVKDYVANGTIAVVASICNERSEFFPDTPTFKDAGYDLGPDFAATYVILCKKGTPQEVKDKFNAAIAKIMSNEENLKVFRNLFYSPSVRTGAEAEKWYEESYANFMQMKEAVANDKW